MPVPTQKTHYDRNLKITTPIAPAVANIEVPADHPLWQFFSQRRFIRNAEDLDTTARPWTIAELRRKSFVDLHSLWYACLRERNILIREEHLQQQAMGGGANEYNKISDRIRTTMWRIRHVLSERDHAFRIAKNISMDSQPNGWLDIWLRSLETEFLEIQDDSDASEILSRWQQSVFGIHEIIEDNKLIDRRFVDGIKYIATLKVRRWASREPQCQEYLKRLIEENSTSNDDIDLTKAPSSTLVRDVGEAFILFTSENDRSSILEAVSAVKDLKTNNQRVSRYDEIATVKRYFKELERASKYSDISKQQA